MSKFTQIPYIEMILSELSADNKQILLNNINGKSADGTEDISYVLKTLPEMYALEEGVYAVVYNYSTTIAWKGYVVITDSYKVFITFKSFKANQTDAEIFDIQSDNLVSKETVSADYVRTLLREDEYIDSTELSEAISEGGGGLPEANSPNKVLVSNNELEWEEKNTVPMADNLAGVPITNDALYTKGPTGGLADIATGEEAYLQEIKGYTIVWNQLMPDENVGTSVTLNPNHIYIYIDNKFSQSYFKQNSSDVVANNSNYSYYVYDLTLMFGGNDKIPFSLEDNTVEYDQNGDLPAKKVGPRNRFFRLFGNTQLMGQPFNAGTFKNVKVSKLIETGRNLWNENDPDMVENGLTIVPGYNYEIYVQGNSKKIKMAFSASNILDQDLLRYRLANGQYIWCISNYDPNRDRGLVKIKQYSSSYPIKYVGFVHSGNYCLTTGTDTNNSYAKTNATIPAYQSHEFNISGINGLNGIPDATASHCSVYDTKDITRIGKIDDLSTLTWTSGTGTYSASIVGIKPNTTHLLATKYLGSEMSVDENGILTITTAASPTGSLIYELSTPVATGESVFEPIPLKDNQGNWIVNDMGSEYFTQPENTLCPVNQISYYFENLKDKLVNLKIPDVEAAPFSAQAPSLDGLKIGETTYKMLPLGQTKYSTDGYYYSSIAIGQGSSANGNYNCIAIGRSSACNNNYDCIAIGYAANAAGSYSTAIGYQSYARDYSISIGRGIGTSSTYGTHSIAIGNYTVNRIAKSVCFDGGGTGWSSTQSQSRILHMYGPSYIYFRNAHSNTTYNTLEQYTSGHYLSEYINNNVLVENGGNYFVAYTSATDYKTFTLIVNSSGQTDISAPFTGAHVTFKLSNHNVVGLDLLPYDSDSSQAFTAYGVVSDTPTFMSAYLDAYGIVHVSLPTGVTIVQATYNLK